MPLAWAELALKIPFRLDCAIHKNDVELEAVFDKDLIAIDQVDSLLHQFEQALQQVSSAGAEQSLGDIDLSGTSNEESVLVESISTKSARVRQSILVSSVSLARFRKPANSCEAPAQSRNPEKLAPTYPTRSFIVGEW